MNVAELGELLAHKGAILAGPRIPEGPADPTWREYRVEMDPYGFRFDTAERRGAVGIVLAGVDGEVRSWIPVPGPVAVGAFLALTVQPTEESL